MGRVIFMCGPAGSGKSTVARQFEQQGMVRLSFDQEAWSRGITAMPLPDDVRGDIEQALRARLADLVRAGVDVVLDFSFWSRRMREDYRELLRPLGVVPETVYLATDRATVLRRIRARAAQDGDDFRLSPELAAAYFDHFEPPTPEEGPLTVLTGQDSEACFACRKHQDRGPLRHRHGHRAPGPGTPSLPRWQDGRVVRTTAVGRTIRALHSGILETFHYVERKHA